MGQAKNKRIQLQQDIDSIQHAARVTSHALRRLTMAASEHLGSDCFVIAKLGQVLLADQGIASELAVGYAAWRVGPGDSDVIAHTREVESHVPTGLTGLAYHAWLVLPAYGALLDFTTYQLRLKARQLDELDGGSTHVDWNPDFLLTPISAGKSYQEVARACAPVAFHYAPEPRLLTLLESTFILDEDNVRMARLVMQHPQAHVMGTETLACI